MDVDVDMGRLVLYYSTAIRNEWYKEKDNSISEVVGVDEDCFFANTHILIDFVYSCPVFVRQHISHHRSWPSTDFLEYEYEYFEYFAHLWPSYI